MGKGLDKGATQLRIEGQCREMNPGGAYAGLADDLGLKAEREVCPTCRGSGSDGGRQYPDGQYEAFKCEACDGFGTAQQGCTLCGSNDHSTTGCPMRAQAAPVGEREVAMPEISAMAKVLSDRAADACNINRDDNWAMYGQEYIDDVQAMLEVARLNKGAGSHE